MKVKVAIVKDISDKPFIVSGNYLDEFGLQKSKTLMKMKAIEYNHDLKKLLAEKNFVDSLIDIGRNKGIPLNSMYGFSVRHGKKAVPVYFEVNFVNIQW